MAKMVFSAGLTIFLLLSGAGIASAQQPSLFQELGAVFTVSSSHHPELPSPVGFAAFARWGFAGSWLFRLSYHRAWEETRKIGTVCTQLSQRLNCRPELVETHATFTGLRGIFSRTVRLGRWGELSLGPGVSFNHVDPEATSVSGHPADLLAPHTGQLGYLANASIAVIPMPRLPVLLVGGYTGHWVNFRGCSGEDPPQYDPFCGWGRFKEIELGVSYTF
jgi:hypothetical protein